MDERPVRPMARGIHNAGNSMEPRDLRARPVIVGPKQ